MDVEDPGSGALTQTVDKRESGSARPDQFEGRPSVLIPEAQVDASLFFEFGSGVLETVPPSSQGRTR